jgi:glycosyltransferase involved in cell wall biosynthesis
VDLLVADCNGDLLEDVPPRVRVIDLKQPRVSRTLGRLVKYLRRERPFGLISRVDHVNIVSALGVVLARVPARLVLTVVAHALTFPDSASITPARALMRRKTLLPVLRWAYRQAHAVVAVSHGIAGELQRELRVSGANIQMIRNPAVTRRIPRMALDRPTHRWFADRRTPILISVGRLVWEKDHATLLRGFAMFHRRRPARLIILGEGPLRSTLVELRRSLGLEGVCELAGHCANPYAAMARADLLVLSSRTEGSPNVLAEALACGCPVVATDCPSGPREILADGKYGLLAPVGDAKSLAAAMEKALATPWDRDELRRRAAQYSSDASARLYLDAVGYPQQWRGECPPREAA